ncbi:hypothetical protein EV702DRAFT_1202762 [Suillus placidus]|uniref:Uncharacterized protein n=1 Tax=Suillus placidus TaxID=48579 RepID=A0A9P7CY34_9AGAM|nr:hypothetical protein EV702DRAFT_1202762 [Suillus placidus]
MSPLSSSQSTYRDIVRSAASVAYPLDDELTGCASVHFTSNKNPGICERAADLPTLLARNDAHYMATRNAFVDQRLLMLLVSAAYQPFATNVFPLPPRRMHASDPIFCAQNVCALEQRWIRSGSYDVYLYSSIDVALRTAASSRGSCSHLPTLPLARIHSTFTAIPVIAGCYRISRSFKTLHTVSSLALIAAVDVLMPILFSQVRESPIPFMIKLLMFRTPSTHATLPSKILYPCDPSHTYAPPSLAYWSGPEYV